MNSKKKLSNYETLNFEINKNSTLKVFKTN